MMRITWLVIGGLVALAVGLVLPHVTDSAFPTRTGPMSFQESATECVQLRHPNPFSAFGPVQLARLRSCVTASDVMNLGAWLVVLGAVALVVAVVVLILSRIRRRVALSAHAV